MPDFEATREFTRIPIHIWGTFADASGDLLTAEVNNLSVRGCHASTFDPLPAGGRYHLTLFVEDDDQALHFEVESRVVRSDRDGMGIEFMEMPLESFEHLRNMVLLNSPDPERVEREFREHIGLKRAV
jgi:PilZ domain